MNVFEISTNVTVHVSIPYFYPTNVKLYREMLSEQGNRFYFIFSFTTHYQNDEFISVRFQCNKVLREVFDISHKNYFNDGKRCLLRCYVKKF